MSFFSKKIGPVFLKETSETVLYIEKMEQLLEKADEPLKGELEKQIKFAKYGEIGEQNVAFELRNSGMDMYILHDIHLEVDGLSAQIDYIVVTRKCIYLIECKNLIGNIEIDNAGNFIRSYEFAGKHFKEGIYSPITQNQRHLQVLKTIEKKSKGNFLSKLLYEKSFDNLHKSIVVIANPKSYLNMKFAPKEIKAQVVRADQLIAYIRKMESDSGAGDMSEKAMLGFAQNILQQNQPGQTDYARKYEELLQKLGEGSFGKNQLWCEEAGNVNQNVVAEQDAAAEKEKLAEKEETVNLPTEAAVETKEKADSKEDGEDNAKEQLRNRLKEFRLEQSRREGIKAYYIFSNEQMEHLLATRPGTKEELLCVSGFGKAKVEKYGDAILEILNGET